MEAGFITYEMLYNWLSFVAIVYMVTQFIKNKKWLKNIDNKNIAFCIALVLLIITHLVGGTFKVADIILYILSAILVTTQNSGIHDASKTNETTEITEIKK